MSNLREWIGRVNWLPVVTVLLGLSSLVLLVLERRADAAVVALVCVAAAVLSRAE